MPSCRSVVALLAVAMCCMLLVPDIFGITIARFHLREPRDANAARSSPSAPAAAMSIDSAQTDKAADMRIPAAGLRERELERPHSQPQAGLQSRSGLPQRVRTPGPPDKAGSARCWIHRRKYEKEHDPSKMKGLLPSSIHHCWKPQSAAKRRLSAGSPDNTSHGAWILSPGSCYHLDVVFAKCVSDMVQGGSLTELGAGKGCYTAYMKAHGVKIVAAVDGARNIGDLTKGLVTTWDLTQPMEAKADWVMSLEVAEHIPMEFEDAFLDNVVRNARCYVILSWSKTTKAGSGHVNARNRTYVYNKMRTLGFEEASDVTGWLFRRAAWMYYARVYFRPDSCQKPQQPEDSKKKG